MSKSHEISEDAVITLLSVECAKCSEKVVEFEMPEAEFVKKLKKLGWAGDENKDPICPKCKKIYL